MQIAMFVPWQSSGDCHGPNLRMAPGLGGDLRYVRGVAGAIIFAVVMIIGLPVAIMMGGAIWSVLFGTVVGADVEARHTDQPE
jgi:hypothetical protein